MIGSRVVRHDGRGEVLDWGERIGVSKRGKDNLIEG